MKFEEYVRILVLLILASLIISSFSGVAVSSSPIKVSKIESISFSFSHVFKFKIITQKDLEKMKHIISEEKKLDADFEHSKFLNYSYYSDSLHNGNKSYPVIDGHATGLRLPDDKELEKLLGHRMIVGIKNANNLQEVRSVRWDLDPHFPPVGDQRWQGSCVAWAVSYYQNGFLQRRIYNWTDDSPAHLMSPAWTYNKANGGVDEGSTFGANAEVIQVIGDATLSNLSYNPNDYVSWGNESAWRDAPKHRVPDFYTLYFGNNSGIKAIKELLQEGYLVTFAMDATIPGFDKGVFGGNYIISSQEYNSTVSNHAQTIVGYDDSISDGGDVGAFRVVNSWGTDWGDHGFYWITYKALEDKVSRGWPYAYVLVPKSLKPYNPKLLATWHFSSPGARDSSINITLGSENSTYYRTMYLNGGTHAFPRFMALDITELYNEWKNSSYSSRFYLKIGIRNKGSGSSTVDSFRIDYYPYGYKTLWQNSTESPDVPATTPVVIESSRFSPSEYFPYLYIKLHEGILHRYSDSNTTEVIVGNAGNKTDTIDLSVNAINGWKVKIRSRVTISPGEIKKITVYIDLPTATKLGALSKLTVSGTSENQTSKRYTVCANMVFTSRPIHIKNDSDMKWQAEKYGWLGNGSKDNPYVISGIYIYKEGVSGIQIKNTNLFMKIENSTFNEVAGDAVRISNTTNLTLVGNFISECIYGVHISHSNGINIDNNTIMSTAAGFDSHSSRDIIITHNTFSENTYGIEIYNSHSIIIENNTLQNNSDMGIYMSYSHQNLICNNSFSSNSYAIYLYFSNNNKIWNNTMKRDGIGISGYINTWSTQNIKGNYINGKPIYYYSNINMHNTSIPKNAGQVILGNVSWMYVKHVTIMNVSAPIRIGYSTHIFIVNCNLEYSLWRSIYLINSSYITIINSKIVKSKLDGLYIYSSSNNTFANNTIEKSGGYGIFLISGSDNILYKNSFYYNHGTGETYSWHMQAYDGGSHNHWDYRGYGNYWLDWANNNDTNDRNNDGIVDWPYKIAGSAKAEDHYPLKNSSIPVAPLSPRNLTTKSGDRYVTLNWEKPIWDGGNSVKHYNIYRNGKLIKTLQGTQLFYTDTNLSNGVTYTYYVTALNSAGESVKSNMVNATPITLASEPQNLTAKEGDGYVNLSWEKPASNGGSEIKEYKIYRNGKLIAAVPQNQLWYNDTGVSNGVTYTYYVTAVNSAGESRKSNVVIAKPSGPVPEFSWLFVLMIAIFGIFIIFMILLVIKRRAK